MALVAEYKLTSWRTYSPSSHMGMEIGAQAYTEVPKCAPSAYAHVVASGSDAHRHYQRSRRHHGHRA